MLKTTATTGEGIEALAAAIAEAGARATAEAARRTPPPPRPLSDRARRRRPHRRAHPDGRARRLDALADAVLSGRLLPADAARKLIDK